MIVPYEPRYLPAFERLNREWIERYFRVEAADLKYFEDPYGKIIAPGGQIFFAVDDKDSSKEPIGTVAAVPIAPGVYELAKMGVTAHAQGQGWGRKLAEAVIEFARVNGGHTVIILSHSSLITALTLYERLGFRHQPVPSETGYERADVYMVLNLRGETPPNT